MEEDVGQSREIVVARYDENIEWVRQCHMPVTVYNKGKDLFGYENIRCVKLENIGREGHTYLYHILTNWDHLADTTIFTQGNPFQHSPDFLKLLNYRFKTVQPLSFRWLEKTRIPPEKTLNSFRQYWVDDCRVFVQYLNHNLMSICPRSFFDGGMHHTMRKVRRIYKIKRGETILGYVWKRLFPNEPLPPLIPFAYVGIFSAPKSAIQSRDKSFYKSCMDFLLEDPNNGYILERLWLYILGYHHTQKNLYKNASRPTRPHYNNKVGLRVELRTLLYNLGLALRERLKRKTQNPNGQ
mgnify:CR=1 FL=1